MKWIILTVLCSGFLWMLGCNRSETETLEDNSAITLYQDVKHLTLMYTDSMKGASDTLAILRLDSSFQAKLTEINMAVSPETDAELTEGQNDTLFRLLQNYLIIKSNRCKKFDAGNSDTVPSP